jgi:hypothetical protein
MIDFLIRENFTEYQLYTPRVAKKGSSWVQQIFPSLNSKNQ